MFLDMGRGDAPVTILLAHGAGAPMDSPYMEAISGRLADRGVRVRRFEFAYMAARRSGARKPPPRAERLCDEFVGFAREAAATGQLVIGGKSLGGRVASMVADELFTDGVIAGLVCLGYPFHPPGKPENLRTKHLLSLQTPALFFQGTRDPFGGQDEVAGYTLSPAITLCWLPDGDHDLKPRKASGWTRENHLETVADRLSAWALKLG